MPDNDNIFEEILTKASLKHEIENLDVLRDDALNTLDLVDVVGRTIKGILSARDFLFARRLLIVINELHQLEPIKRFELANKINADDKFARRLGHKFIQIIDKIDDDIKAIWIAKIFRNYLFEEIDQEMLLRQMSAIEKLDLLNIPYLREFYNEDHDVKVGWDRYYIQHNLADAGLINLASAWGGLRETTNDIGKYFLNYIIDGEN